MAIQTTYPQQLQVAVEGLSVDASFDSYRMTAVNVAAESFFGRACLAVTGEGDEFVQPTGSAGVFLGVLQWTSSVEPGQITGTSGEGLPINKPGAVMRRGRIWVVAEDVVSDVTVGVFYRHTTPGAAPEALGRFRTDADTADATQVTVAKWVTTTTAVGQLAQIELNLP